MYKLLFGIVLGVVIGVFACKSFSTLFEKVDSNGLTQITVKNESGKNVKRATLQHHGGSFEATGLKNHDEVQFVFKNEGENVYTIHVTFEDASTLTSQEMYFEYGYKMTETIKRDTIVSDIGSFKKQY